MYVMSNKIESLIQILPFARPTVRSDAPKTVDALEKIRTLETSRSRYVNSVYTVMKKCTKMSYALGLSCSVQTIDQQLYCITKQVMWHLLDEFNNHTL